MRPISKTAWPGLCAAVLAAGCGGTVRLDQSELPPALIAAPVELTATGFYPQSDSLCGPAALATVLDASGAEVTLAGQDMKLTGRTPVRRSFARTAQTYSWTENVHCFLRPQGRHAG